MDGKELDAIQKSVLRYPGGKSRAVSFILDLIPENTQSIVAPFFGGGSVELACASLGIKTTGYDIFVPLINFWQCAIEDSHKLAKIVRKYHPLSKEKFYQLQKEQMSLTDKWESGAVFFVLNRASFSGSTLSGGMSPGHPRFNEGAIERLENFKIENLKVKLESFETAILKHPSDLLYCDPPYLIKNTLYGNKGDTHRGFDHAKLAEILKTREKWILSYNNSPEIQELYKGYDFLFPEWKYGMSKDKDSKEIIILSPDLSQNLKK